MIVERYDAHPLLREIATVTSHSRSLGEPGTILLDEAEWGRFTSWAPVGIGFAWWSG